MIMSFVTSNWGKPDVGVAKIAVVLFNNLCRENQTYQKIRYA